MNLKKLIKEVSLETRIDEKTVQKVTKTFFNLLGESFTKGETRLPITGLGSFYLLKMKERKNRNPNSGEMMLIPGKVTLRFKPSSKMLDLLNL